MNKLFPGLYVLTFFLFSGTISFAQCGQAETVKAMTFNIRYDNPDDGKNSWENRKDKVVSMINFYSADIIGTQEVLKNQKKYLDENLPDYKSVGVGRTDGKTEGEYSAVFYRHKKFDLLGSGTFWLSETPDVIGSVGWDAALERIATWVKLKSKSTNEEFLFINTHFDHRGQLARVESANLIMEKAKELADNLPVILCGDFNFDETSEAYSNITKNDNFNLVDARFVSENPHHGPRWTFHGFSEDNGHRAKIDFIFVNDKVIVKKHAVLSDRFDGGYPSDHLPVYVEVSFN